jgi:hypothetical protein
METSSHGLIQDTQKISVEELGEISKSVSQDSLSSGRNMNAGPPEYETGVPTAQPAPLFFEQRKTANMFLVSFQVLTAASMEEAVC